VVDLTERPATTAFSENVGLCAVRYMESVNLCLFRLSNGRTGGTIFGVPVILLTTSGRRTGTRRTKPLLALEDAGSWIVVASRGGTQHDPDWYRNLEAYAAQVEAGGPKPGAVELAPPEVEPAGAAPVEVVAERLKGRERREWWDRLLEVYPRFGAYQARTPRMIPVLRLTPADH
jgi:hypothetical protein